MSSIKRTRGRPRGTGLDDGPTLRTVADMLAADPSLKPTTAIRHALDKPTETAVRRLQGKWQHHGAQYRADAQARRSVVPMPVRRPSPPYSPRTARQMMEAHRRMQEALGPSIRAAQELANSPGFMAAQEAARRLQESPALRAAQELANSPAFLAAQEAARRIHESPSVRAMRELHESPTFRVIREAQAQMSRMLGGY